MRPIIEAVRRAFAVVAAAAVATFAAPRAQADDGAYQLIQEPDAGYSSIVGLIGTATHSVRMTMYELTDPAAINALIDAHRRGVEKRRLRSWNPDGIGLVERGHSGLVE